MHSTQVLVLSVGLVSLALSAHTAAQCVQCNTVRYTAASGLPQAPCFVPDGGAAAYAILNQTLVISSTSTAFAFVAGPDIFPFHWSDRLALQFTARVQVGGSAFSPGPGFRAAAMVLANDSDKQTYGIAVWSNGVAFTSHWNFQPVSGLFEAIEFDAASDFHTYSIASDPDGAAFLIDGVQRAYLPKGGKNPQNPPFFDFGVDSRYSGPTLSEWKAVSLSLKKACPGDLDCDRMVTDADFVEFAHAYDVLLCEDPQMPSGCPADFNHDGVVDDSDFSVFAAAYNQLVCD